MNQVVNKISVILLGLFVFLGSVKGFASTTTPLRSWDVFRVGQGDVELDVSFRPELLRGDASLDSVEFTLGANYFWTDILAPGLEFNFVHTNAGNTARLFPNVKAYWPLDSRWMPYVQAGFGYARIPGQNSFDFGLGPGINYLLSNTVAFGAQFRYDLLVGSGTVHDIQFPLEFAIFFKL